MHWQLSLGTIWDKWYGMQTNKNYGTECKLVSKMARRLVVVSYRMEWGPDMPRVHCALKRNGVRSVAGVHSHPPGSGCPCLRCQGLQAPPPEHAGSSEGQCVLQPDELVSLSHLHPCGGHLQVHGDHDGGQAGGCGLC